MLFNKLLAIVIIVQLISNAPDGCQCRSLSNKSKLKKWESSGHFEGDIVFKKDSQSAAIKGNQYRWPKATIPYVLTSGDFNKAERLVIAKAMRDFHKNTCIRFIPRTKENDYIKLKKTGDGCWSFVGRQRRGQVVSLDKGCVEKGTVIHELMHVVGFEHEQARTDRDKFVTIHWDNIDPENYVQFEKYNSTQVDLLKTEYDSKSIMHYGQNAFAINPSLPTITNKDGTPVDPNTEDFSKTDIIELNRLYCKAG